MTDTTKPVLYVDLDNTIVDFQSGIDRLPSKAKVEYGPSAEEPEGHYDDAPGIFSLMEPLPGAIEGFRALAKEYDAYILSTAPWHNSSAWQHKLEWVQLHFGVAEFVDGERNPAYKRLILSHHKALNRGAYLVDDRRHPGFQGEQLLFASADYPDWAAVTARLLEQA